MKIGRVVCIDCRFHRHDGLSHWCHNPQFETSYYDPVTGKTNRSPRFCNVPNHDGNCTGFEPKPEPTQPGVVARFLGWLKEF